MVRDVVGLIGVGDQRRSASFAARGAVGIGDAEIETLREETP